MKNSLITLLFCLYALCLTAQTTNSSEPNIVPNPGFERFSAVPIGWFYKGEDYTRVMQYWHSPTGASPDIFGPKVRVPEYWLEKDFGKQPPHDGGAMTGMTVYGCDGGKPHCREYVQIQLAEPLVVGQTYHAEMWLSHLPKSLRVSNIGMYFSEEALETEFADVLEQEAQIKADKPVDASRGKWQKVTGQFVATTEAEFLTIGNFSLDEDTEVEAVGKSALKYGYYYVDDIVVRKIPPYINVPIKADDLSLVELSAGETIQLKDIYFDFNSWDLHPRSFVELKKLRKILSDNPSMKIEIIGHTDSIGKDRYNQYLSRKRAKSVVLYLMDNDIPYAQLDYKGKGSSEPIATNETSEGRKMNRRVAFRILENQ